MSARPRRAGPGAAPEGAASARVGEAAPSARVRVRRKPDRAAYDRATIDSILDEGLVAHLGFVDGGQPYVIPVNYARIGDAVYVHGSSASRAMRLLAAGEPACLTVTLLDGLVLARSANGHSMNYRSVVALASGQSVADPVEKLAALRAVVEKVGPGRWDEVRPPTEQELKATVVVSLSLAEASAKIRMGPPADPPEDVALAAWAGVLPLRQVPGVLEAAPDLTAGTPASAAVRRAWRA